MLMLFAVLLAPLLALVGLTIDGGRIYFEKRRMQAAADGGAFGAAREILRGNDSLVISGGQDDAELGQGDGCPAEAIGFDDVGAGREVSAMDVLDDLGPGEEQVFGAVLELRSAVVLDRDAASMDLGPHAAVEQEDAGVQQLLEELRSVAAIVHEVRADAARRRYFDYRRLGGCGFAGSSLRA